MRENYAFLSGFRRGLTAPFSLFAPRKEREPLQLKQVKTKSVEEAWADSWTKIGKDMCKAMGYVAERVKQS